MGFLAGKIAIVTGAGQGVGRGIALALAEQGASLMLAGRTLAKVEAVAAEIQAAGGTARAILCDVKQPAQIEATVKATLDAYGGIDILVNNAQQVPLGSMLDMSEAALIAGWESGPLADFRFMRACHPHLKARGGGVIINLATTASVRWDMKGYGGHGATKDAIRNFTRAAASEWGPDNIGVIAIAPLAMSPGVEGWIRDYPDEAIPFLKTVPLQRVGRLKEDIGAFVAQLCGPDAKYLTGMTIPVDGGQAKMG